MALVLEEDGFVGWKGATDALVHVKVTVAGSSKLVDVGYNGSSIENVLSTDPRTWVFTFKIAPGSHRLIFTFASMQPDTIDIYEIGSLPAPVVAAPRPAEANAQPATTVGPSGQGVVPALAAGAEEEQEIAGVAHAQAAILAPLIKGL